MSEEDVRTFLQYETKALVDFAIALVNLTWKERMIIELCGMQKYTQDDASGKTGLSVDTVQRCYRKGMCKLQSAWSGMVWIKKVIS